MRVVLFFLSIGSCFVSVLILSGGFLILADAKSALHEIEAFILFVCGAVFLVCAAVLLSGAAVVEAVSRLGESKQKHPRATPL